VTGLDSSPLSPRRRFGVSTFSSSFSYWSAQFFCENQSFGLSFSPKGFMALLTEALKVHRVLIGYFGLPKKLHTNFDLHSAAPTRPARVAL
jgi:hypothetical protein